MMLLLQLSCCGDCGDREVGSATAGASPPRSNSGDCVGDSNWARREPEHACAERCSFGATLCGRSRHTEASLLMRLRPRISSWYVTTT